MPVRNDGVAESLCACAGRCMDRCDATTLFLDEVMVRQELAWSEKVPPRKSLCQECVPRAVMPYESQKKGEPAWVVTRKSGGWWT